MASRAIGLLTVFILSPSAYAGAIVELVPDDPGPYYGGESLTVDVWLHNEESFDVTLNFLRLDFSDSDPMVSLGQTFTFDFSSLPSGGVGYQAFLFPDLPVPWTWNTLDCVCPELRLQLPGDGSLHIGSVTVGLSIDPGGYLIDALNAAEPDEMLGAKFGSWRAYDGNITGDALELVVVPEPATLSFLALGGFAIVRRKVPRRLKRR